MKWCPNPVGVCAHLYTYPNDVSRDRHCRLPVLYSDRTVDLISSMQARLRAKMTADSGLAAAIHLLKDNTRYGNYITAMPAPSPRRCQSTPKSIVQQIRQILTHGVKADDYLRLDNAAGEILISRATGSSSPGPDPRPTPEPIPTPLAASSPFTVTAPNLSASE